MIISQNSINTISQPTYNSLRSKQIAFTSFKTSPNSLSSMCFDPAAQELMEHFKKIYNLKQQKPVQWKLKRAIDYTGAIAAIVVASPLMLLTAIAIKLESKGPILFKQQRLGKAGKLFTIYKFRSMYNDASKSFFPIKNGNDSHITRVGKFIRKYSLDEMPQLFNILKGDMSFIGPRPIVIEEYQRMSNIDPNVIRRYAVLPGAKINYRKNSKYEFFKEKIVKEKEYLENWNLWKDIKIFGAIIKDILTGNNY